MTQAADASRPSSPAGLAARWQLRLLGGFVLSDAHDSLTRLPSRAVTLLLARLALQPQREHPREELIDLLWPQVELEVGRNRLRQALSTLRALLEPAGGAPLPVLHADRRAVRLAETALATDVQALHAALQRGDAMAVARLYRGELLPGFFDEWVQDERRHLAARVEPLLAAAPAPPPVAAAALALEAHGTAKPWLPRYLTRMVGYEAEGAQLAAAVRQHRLVLLRGPGGAGKTRLAVEVARNLAQEPPLDTPSSRRARFDLVAFVPLAGCTTREAVHAAVLAALRQDGHRGSEGDRVVQALAGRRVLLVLDNAEHLVEALRGDILRWLGRLDELHLLVTSRRVLGVDGEHELQLLALPLPAREATLDEQAMNPAVALFADRARAVRGDFHLGERNHEQVAAVVRLLHGLPLAIELAAARVRSIGLPEMLELLRGAGREGAALGLLSRSGPRGADDPRHASMLRVVEWSVDRLAPAEHELLQVLSAFRGGATLAALAAVQGRSVAEVAAPLDELVASSVVMLLPGSDGRVRYQPFEPVREVLRLRMGAAQRAALADAHLQWMRDWAGSLGLAPSLPGFREELPNLVAAMEHGVGSGQPLVALAMAVDSARAWDDLALPDDARDCLLRAIAATDAQAAGGAELVARVRGLLAEQCYETGHAAEALALAEQALAEMPAHSRWRADALYTAARLRLRVADDTASTGALIDQGLAAARDAQRHEVQARLLALRGVLALRRDHDAEAKIGFDRQALAIWQTLGPKPRIAEGLVNLALGLGFAHRPLEQLPLLAEAIAEARAQQQHRLLAFVLSVHGYVLADLRRWDESAAEFRECLHTAWAHSAWREWFYGLWNLPRTLVRQGEAERAVQLMGFADRFAAERFGQLGWTDLYERRRTRRMARRVLGAEREAAAWERGRELTPAQAMHLATRAGKP